MGNEYLWYDPGLETCLASYHVQRDSELGSTKADPPWIFPHLNVCVRHHAVSRWWLRRATKSIGQQELGGPAQLVPEKRGIHTRTSKKT